MSYTKSNVEIAAASVIGRVHRRSDRPCQDAFAVRRADAGLVAVVCDGCGSGAHSELGARLGANLFAAALAARLDGDLGERTVWRAACDEVLDRLRGLVPALGELGDAVRDHFLFTLLAVAVTPRGAAILAIGDGVVIVDGAIRVLDAADNAPPYLGYELVGGAVGLDLTVVPAPGAIVIASDGAAPLLSHAGDELPAGRGAVLDLAAVAADDRLFRNPDALRRRLAVASQPGGVLDDDTTVVALRWGRPC